MSGSGSNLRCVAMYVYVYIYIHVYGAPATERPLRIICNREGKLFLVPGFYLFAI